MANMPIHMDQRDFAAGIDLASHKAVADEVCCILAQRYDAFAPDPVRQAFIDIEDAHAGRYPGLLACDTPYHDLYHALSTALLMARMVDGYEASHGADLPAFGCDLGCVAVLLALFHDIGFLRRESEAHLNGARLVHDHEQRSVDFVQAYLANGVFADHAARAGLILATNFNLPIHECLSGQPAEFLLMGQMLGAADLVSQVGERYYLERCRDFLFDELTAAGADRRISADGSETVYYSTPEDLLRKTPEFFEHVVKRRLDVDLAQVDRFISPHFGGDDPYARGIQRNMAHLRDMIQRNDFSRLQRKPASLLLPTR
jgi:hypothetical protein